MRLFLPRRDHEGGEAFVQPELLPRGAGNQGAPPLVRQFVRDDPAVGRVRIVLVQPVGTDQCIRRRLLRFPTRDQQLGVAAVRQRHAGLVGIERGNARCFGECAGKVLRGTDAVEVDELTGRRLDRDLVDAPGGEAVQIGRVRPSGAPAMQHRAVRQFPVRQFTTNAERFHAFRQHQVERKIGLVARRILQADHPVAGEVAGVEGVAALLHATGGYPAEFEFQRRDLAGKQRLGKVEAGAVPITRDGDGLVVERGVADGESFGGEGEVGGAGGDGSEADGFGAGERGGGEVRTKGELVLLDI